MQQQIFTPEEMPNEEYHSRDGRLKEYVSGTTLCKIYNQSLAHWKYAEETESPALHFGIASHAAFLEPELFEAEFIRGVDKSDYDNLITSEAGIKAILKERGITGYSTKKKPELLAMLSELEDVPPTIWQLEEAIAKTGKVVVKAKDYDDIMKMRKVLWANPVVADALEDMTVEHTYLAEIEGVKVKVRPDIVTKNGEIWDYKTSLTAKPDEFSMKAYKLGYYLKMALQHDVIYKATACKPSRVVLLAQEKASPFVAKPLAMSEQQLEIGRVQYKQALKEYKKGIESNVFPAYGNGIEVMTTPEWVLREFNLI